MTEPSDKELKALILNALRHDPDSIGILLDSEGYVTREDFLGCANLSSEYVIRPGQLDAILSKDGGALFEVRGTTFRAITGHTTDQFDYPPAQPDEPLYYLVSQKDYDAHIEEWGLEPVRTRYIPLERTAPGALATQGKRRIKKAHVLLEISKDSPNLFLFCNRWYCTEVPPAYITRRCEV